MAVVLLSALVVSAILYDVFTATFGTGSDDDFNDHKALL